MGADAVVIPFTLQLFARGVLPYEVQSVQASLGANGVNVCIVNLAVGRNENNNTPVDVDFQRGDDARVVVSNLTIDTDNPDPTLQLIAANSFTLFDGVIDDVGSATLSYGTFAVQVRLFGRLAHLASGTLGTSNIVPKSYLDTGVTWQLGGGTRDESQIDVSSARNELWGPLQDTLEEIATSGPISGGSITDAIVSTFGSDVNSLAASVLSDVEGTLRWNSAARNAAEAIVLTMNQQMAREWFYESFLNRIVGFAEMLRFAIIENGSSLKVRPYQPFFRRTSSKVIFPRTYDTLRWDFQPYKSYAGALLTGGSGQSNNRNSNDLVVGRYKIPGTPLGQVHVGPVPGYVAQASTALAQGGDGLPRELKTAPNVLADRLAKLITWELNFGGRNIQVSCPMLRADIGPLEAVQVDFPAVEEISAAVDTPAMYGSVQRVTVVADAMKQIATTTYDIGYVRSYQQQRNIIDPGLSSAREHPFFDTNYIGGRLDSSQDRTLGLF